MGSAVIASHRSRWSLGLSAESALPIAVLVAFIFLTVIPLLSLFREAFTDMDGNLTAANFFVALSDGYNLEALGNTVVLSLAVAIISLILGAIFAFGLSRTTVPFKRTLRAIVMISIISPGFLTAFAYVILLGPNSGYINVALRWLLDLGVTSGPLDIYSGTGFVLLSVPMGIGICILQLTPALSNLDSSVEEASRMAGAGTLATLFGVTFRLITPALLSGFVLTFILSLSLYGTPQILGINVASVAIRQSLLVVNDMKGAAVLSISVTLIALVSVAIYRRATMAQKRYETVGNRGAKSDLFDIGRWKYVIVTLTFIYGAVAFVLPYATLLYISFLRVISDGLAVGNLTMEHYVGLVADDFTRTALINSLYLSFASALVVIVLGIAAGYVLVRVRTRIRPWIDYLSILPLGLAGTAFGIAVLLTYLNPPLRVLGLQGTLTILLLAYAAHFISFGVRGVQTGLMQISTELSEAARMCGSTRLGTLRDVDIPLIKGSVVSTGLLVAILCFPELSISVMLKSVGTQVVATSLLDRWEGAGGLQSASAMAILIFALVAIVLSFVYGVLSRDRRKKA